MTSATNFGNNSHVLSYPRLNISGYFADFRRDKRLNPEVYHCVVQRDGSAQILSWTQYHSLDAAREGAESEIRRLLSGKLTEKYLTNI